MAVKVPPLLHKMSKAAQKAWYKKNNMEMPSSKEGKSAAKAKKVAVIKKTAATIKPKSTREINAERQKAYYAKGGRAPIGAGGSGGSNAMAGVGMSNIKQIKAAIKAGVNPKVAESVVNEATKAEAEKMLGGTVKEKPKMPPGKQPAGYRYVRNLARKAMKAGLKKEEGVEKINEISRQMDKVIKKPSSDELAADISSFLAKGGVIKTYKPQKSKFRPGTALASKHDTTVARASGSASVARSQVGKNIGLARAGLLNKMLTPTKKEKMATEEVAVDEAKKPDASVAMTNQLRMKAISTKDKQTLGKVADLMAAQKKQDKKPMKEESEMQYIEEKLTASDPVSMWISDFVRSDNPKFAGKSKKERIQQALGAYYAAKRGKNEEFEIEESKKMDKMDKEAEAEDDMEEDDEEEMDEAYIGFKKLKAKIAAKGGVRNPAAVAASIGRKKYGKEKFQAMAAAGKRKANEEVEQIDEQSPAEIKAKYYHDQFDKVKPVKAYDKEGKLVGRYRSMDHAKQMKPGHTYKVEEAVEGKTPETSTEVALAKKHGDPKKITYGDVIKARIEASKKKALNKGE